MPPADTAYPALDLTIRGMDESVHYLHIGAVMEFQGPRPDTTAVLDHVRRRLPSLPVLSDCAGHLADHVGELRVPGCRSGQWTRAYDALVNAPALGCAQRPWEVRLVGGADGDGYLLCYRAHHALHDGVSLMRLIRLLFALTDPAATAARQPERHKERPGAGTRLRGRLRVAAATARLLAARPPRRPLLAGAPDNRRVVTTAVVPVGRLRAAARALDCSVLDLHLAALSRVAEAADPTGWTTERGRSRGVVVPVSLDQVGVTPYAGNRFALALVGLPWKTRDLAERARILSGRTGGLGDPGVRWAMGKAMERLGPAGVQALSGRMFARAGLQSTVLGFTADVGFAGLRARRFTNLHCLPAPFPYQPALTLWRQEAVCSFTADTALPAAEKLADLWLRAIDELAPAVDAS
ncbi:wax ester/triacylglycerol synthase domain-containing protein [Streptomyces sp. NPDC048659]|uniref:wax ester/triacylglycerol synthase domain-containing protein n=1 Tax=Streptomyces sp. NPDC048659 TaxID=3155489 RepID=UPI003426F05C